MQQQPQPFYRSARTAAQINCRGGVISYLTLPLFSRCCPGDRPADWELTDPVIIEGEAVPRVSALLLIDSQDGFRESYNEAIPNMAKILGLFRQKCFPVVFKLWMLGGEATAQGRQIGSRRFVNKNEYHELRCAPKLPLEELAPRTREEANRTMLTYHYSSFHQNPRLLSLLKEWKVNTVVLVGGYAEHCSKTVPVPRCAHPSLLCTCLTPRIPTYPVSRVNGIRCLRARVRRCRRD